MTTSKDLLIITASNGENLKLAERFERIGTKIGADTKLIDLTELDLTIFNPRNSASERLEKSLQLFNEQLNLYSHWVICAPEYNGSIPPILTNAIAWLSVQGKDFRRLFNGRPIAIASHSGGGCMALLVSLRIQLSHLGAQVLGRQLTSNKEKPAKDESIEEILRMLLQMQPLS